MFLVSLAEVVNVDDHVSVGGESVPCQVERLEQKMNHPFIECRVTDNGLIALCCENFEVKIRRACKNEVECFPAQIGFSGFEWCADDLIVILFFLFSDEFVNHFTVSGLESGVGIVCEV